MSINIGQESSKLTIYKDEQGKYKIYIKGTELKGNGEKQDIFMIKKVQFRRGVEVKNKSIIEVIKGWLDCYRIPIELDENGESKYKYFDKIFVSEFNLLEEGTDEVQKTKQLKQEPQDSFAFNIGQDDDLPF